MRRSLLDTDTLSQYLRRKNPHLSHQAARYLEQFHRFSFSLMTRYEILRGLKAKGAARQLPEFDALCAVNGVLPITDAVMVQAADLYADLRRRGELIEDADLIIAATALVHRLVLVTANTDHFSRIKGLELDCWTSP